MRQFFLTLSLLACCFISVTATPPVKKLYPHRQPNGEIVMIQKHGDGIQGFYSNEQGLPLLLNDNGALCYVVMEGNRPVASAATFSAFDPQQPDHALISIGQVVEQLNASKTQVRGFSRSLNAVNKDGLGIFGQSANGCVKSVGSITIPVVMVEFPDREFAESTTIEKVSRQLNEKGYADETFCNGSVKDYFESQSQGAFSPSFEVVAKVIAGKDYAHYGQNKGSDIDVNAIELIKEAVNKAEAQGVDFSQYKVEGKIPLVSIYYAGPGEHSAFEAGSEDYLWAHFMEYSFKSEKGVQIGSYFIGNELFQHYEYNENDEIVVTDAIHDGIGVFCHEFSHALGLPDFYYTGSNATISDTLITMDFWSIMDYGQYAYDGYAPVPYNAYERCYMGWLNLVELSADHKGENTLYPLGQEQLGNTAYLLRNDANEKEYYILENRQTQTEWHPKFLGNGMLITHVDYKDSEWTYNRVNNNPAHQRMQYIPADGVRQSNSTKNGWNDYKGDLFPGIAYNFSFTDATIPASSVFTGDKLQKPIYDISETAGAITFYFLEDKAASAIDGITVDDAAQEQLYDLTGRRVLSVPQRGIYISNGKKYVK